MLILLVFERDDIEKEVLCAGTHHAKRKKSQVARVGGDLNGLEIATPGEERWEAFLFPARAGRYGSPHGSGWRYCRQRRTTPQAGSGEPHYERD